MNVVEYYRITKWHSELLGNEIPVNIWQLYELFEIKLWVSGCKCVDKCITYVKLDDIPAFYDNIPELTEDMLEAYPWENLIESIKSNGILNPILLERIVVGGKIRYFVVEGKHRLAALSCCINICNEYSIPSILLDKDYDYTEYMRNEKLIHPKQPW